MTASEIIGKIEAVGGILSLNGNRIRCDAPKRARALVEALRPHRNEVLHLLREREQLAGHNNDAFADDASTCGWHLDPYNQSIEEMKDSKPPVMPEGGEHWAIDVYDPSGSRYCKLALRFKDFAEFLRRGQQFKRPQPQPEEQV